ncbi:MAG TPA: hypothetical protein VL240_12120 [Candidatus Binatia bacterium]|nr:hypothetical protein [Candidatus Binatia bacterium]
MNETSPLRPRVRRYAFQLLTLLTVLAACPHVRAQTCSTGPDLDTATKSAIEGAARRYLEMSKNGDVAGLKANAIPAITGEFSSIEQAVVTNKQYFAEGSSTVTGSYLLDASVPKAPLQRADFYCGIYNSPDRLAFSIPNLPPGRYAVAIQKVNGKEPITLTLILQNVAGAWKLAGYYPRLDSIGGHDGQWYLTKAREYKSKGELHNAWFYYLTAWDLSAPVNFMSTPQLDKIAQEMQGARPGDLPNGNSPLSIAANGKTFRVTELTAVPVDNNLDLRIRYENPDAANSGVAFQDNMALIKAVVGKYPELREGFSSVIARAVDGSGHEYGSLLPVKDIK